MKKNETMENLVDSLNAIPFLFVGSGFSKRYFDLPDWKTLLKHMVDAFNNDEFAYRSYEDGANFRDNLYGINPTIASMIEKDYNKAWFSQNSIREVDGELLEQVKLGCTPFKAELAQFIKVNSKLNSKHKNEVTLLKNISKKSIAGIITTNYDMFFEKYLSEFKVYVGQDELLFSQLQGIAEVYKIHGSITEPQSIIINEQDYRDFKEKREYLAAKLLTIFMEYPIIFLGYSISDTNVRNILSSIVKCMSIEKVERLKEKFIFVNYIENFEGYEIGESTFTFENGKMLSMIKLTLSDYSILFNALGKKKMKLPVRVLRILKEELYEYSLTNEPTKKMRVASIDDDRVSNDDLVLSVGTISTLNINGLKGISSDQWYRNIVMNDSKYSDSDLMSVSIELSKQMSGTLPVNSLIHSIKNKNDFEAIIVKEFDDLISATMKKDRARNSFLKNMESVKNLKLPFCKELLYMAYLQESQINLKDLQMYLNTIFVNTPNVLTGMDSTVRTNLRRLIRIYDFLEGKTKNSTKKALI